MVVFSLFAVFLFSSIVKDGHAASWNMNTNSLETAKWLCVNHPYAAKPGGFTANKVKNGNEAYYCELTFNDRSTAQEDLQSLCQYHYPADWIKAERNGDTIVCTYEILYLCPAGQFPVGELCIEYKETPLNFADAENDCAKRGGSLPSGNLDALMAHIINSANPRTLGFNARQLWLTHEGKKYLGVLVRGLDSPLLGTLVESDGSEPGSYSCLYYGMKTYGVYEKECTIYKEQFKLPAYFDGGTCYMMSPSVHLKDKAGQLHQYCQWLSPDDRVVTPVSVPRRDGIDNALAGTIFENNYVLTTGEKDKGFSGEAKAGWKVVNVDQKEMELFGLMWAMGRPNSKDTDGTPNLRAVVLPKRKRQGDGMMYDVPKYFRAHPVCGVGITAGDNKFMKCDDGWQSVTRDNGRVMCAKAFTTELEYKTYDEAMTFCATHGAVLAPMESVDEQELIIDLMNTARPASGGAMWLGARRNESGGEFYWAIDDKVVGNWIGNWTPNEPNNVNQNEHCLQIYTGGVHDRPRGKWNDIYCTMTRSGNGDEIKGGVCAKYYIPQ